MIPLNIIRAHIAFCTADFWSAKRRRKSRIDVLTSARIGLYSNSVCWDINMLITIFRRSASYRISIFPARSGVHPNWYVPDMKSDELKFDHYHAIKILSPHSVLACDIPLYDVNVSAQYRTYSPWLGGCAVAFLGSGQRRTPANIITQSSVPYQLRRMED